MLLDFQQLGDSIAYRISDDATNQKRFELLIAIGGENEIEKKWKRKKQQFLSLSIRTFTYIDVLDFKFPKKVSQM